LAAADVLDWVELDEEERAAAAALGYTEESWVAVDVDDLVLGK